MNIAFFTESFTPYISGVSRVVEILEKELSLLGHNVYVFAPYYPNYKDKKNTIIRLPSIPTKYPDYRIAIPFFNLPNVKFDIIHSHTPFTLGLISKRISRRKRIPFVYSFHTIFTEYLHHIPLPTFISKPFLLAYLKRFIKTCDKVIVPNQITLDYILKNDIYGNFEIIPNGVDTDLLERTSAEGLKGKLNIKQNYKVLLYVGRLSKEKNVSFLIRSFALASKNCSNLILLLAGKGPEENNLKIEAKRFGVCDKIIFLGEIPYPDIFKFYKISDIFVFASKTETQGIVIAEAKYCGLPVIAINAAGVKDSIEDKVDGFLTEENEFLFAEKIVYLCINEQERKIMSQKAIDNASKKFSSKIVAKNLEAVYNSLLRKDSNI